MVMWLKHFNKCMYVCMYVCICKPREHSIWLATPVHLRTVSVRRICVGCDDRDHSHTGAQPQDGGRAHGLAGAEPLLHYHRMLNTNIHKKIILDFK